MKPLRRVCAFPLRDTTIQPHRRRLEGSAFQAVWARNNRVTSPGKREAFRKAGGVAVLSLQLARQIGQRCGRALP